MKHCLFLSCLLNVPGACNLRHKDGSAKTVNGTCCNTEIKSVIQIYRLSRSKHADSGASHHRHYYYYYYCCCCCCCCCCYYYYYYSHSNVQFDFFTISLRGEPSPTRMLKWPGRNRVQITCNTSSAYHVQHVVLRATWYKGTAQLLCLIEFKSHLSQLYFIGWTTNLLRWGGNRSTRRNP